MTNIEFPSALTSLDILVDVIDQCGFQDQLILRKLTDAGLFRNGMIQLDEPVISDVKAFSLLKHLIYCLRRCRYIQIDLP